MLEKSQEGLYKEVLAWYIIDGMTVWAARTAQGANDGPVWSIRRAASSFTWLDLGLGGEGCKKGRLGK